MGEHRFRALTVEIIKAVDPETAADMILSMLDRASPPESRQVVVANGGARRVIPKRGPRSRPSLAPVDPADVYAPKEAAKLMGMKIGYFRVWYAKPGNIEVTRRSVHGMTRCSFTGQAILDARAKRFGQNGESQNGD